MGFLYGFAYAVARGEDPFEPNEKVAGRAYDAANAVFNDPKLRNLGFVKAFEAHTVDYFGGGEEAD